MLRQSSIQAQKGTSNNEETRNLWEEAVTLLSEEEKRDIDFNRDDKLAILKDVVLAVEEKKELCLTRRWRFRRKSGEYVVLRDVLEKTITWVRKFQEVGDLAVQYDPGHAALPWAGVRFFLQAAINDSQTFGAMAEGMEMVSHLIARYAIFEDLYLRRTSIIIDQLSQSLVKLYAAVLRYLSRARGYYSQNTAKRVMKSIAQPADIAVDIYLRIISQAQADVDSCARLADASYFQIEIDLLHQENRLKLLDILSDLEKPIDRIAGQVSDLHVSLEKSERRDILRWISVVPQATHHRTMISDCLPDSGAWLFRKPEFIDWRKSSVSSIMWLHGIPGSGKSKIVSSMIESFQNKTQTDKPSGPMAFFYCLRNAAEPHRADPEEVLRSITKQLAGSIADRATWASVAKIYQERKEVSDEEGGDPAKLTVDDCIELILSFTERNPLTIVVDALDECDPSRRYKLLLAFEKIIQNSANLVKFFVSSRDDRDIVCRLSNSPNVFICASDNGEDIERFVHAEVSKSIEKWQLSGGNDLELIKPTIIAALIEGAQGMFRWVSLQIQNLFDPDRMMLEEDIITELGRLPKTLSDLYDIAYQRITTAGPKSRALAERALKWLLCANRTLQTSEFIAAVSVDPEGRCVKISNSDLLNICSNMVVLDVELDIYRFAHLSVREYLESRDEYVDVKLNELATERCLGTYFSEADEVPHTTLEKALNQTLRPYASLYWPIHLLNAGGDNVSPLVIDKVKHFIFGNGAISFCFESWSLDAIELGRSLKREDPLKEKLRTALLPAKPPFPGSLPLFLGCTFGWAFVIEHLSQLGFDGWDQRNNAGSTGLQIASRYGYTAVLRLLLEKGADAKSKGPYGKTALHKAATYGHEDVVRQLLMHGADVESMDRDCTTALHRAAGNGHVTVARLLLAFGAKMEAKGTYGKTALYLAVQNLHEAVVRLLLENGADANTQSNDGNTALNSAAISGHKGITKLLLEKLSNADFKDRNGKTALEVAAWGSYEVIMRLLLQHGADVEAKGKYGESALYRAVWNGQEAIVRLLLEHGADVTAKSNSGETVLYRAIDAGHEGIVRLLLAHATDDVVESWSDLLQKSAFEGKQVSEEMKNRVKEHRPDQKTYSPVDFQFLNLIGKGTSSQVFRVKKKDSERTYAMKVISKEVLVKQRKVAQILGKRNILVRTAVSDSPFIVSLKFSFQTPEHLYLVTDYMAGGDLLRQIKRKGALPQDCAKFYIAEVILALQHLHENNIIFGDLRSEKILLDEDGHIALCNFGQSELGSSLEEDGFEKFNEYTAPELLVDQTSYTKMVDFWSIGVLFFEMVCGWNPFFVEDNQQMAKNILFDNIRFPPRKVMNHDAKKFVLGLLQRDPLSRLGSNTGAEEIKSHPFLADCDWVSLSLKKTDPPFKPTPLSEQVLEASNWDVPDAAAFTTDSMPGWSMPLSPSMQADFKGFSFVDETNMDQHFREEGDTDRENRDDRLLELLTDLIKQENFAINDDC